MNHIIRSIRRVWFHYWLFVFFLFLPYIPYGETLTIPLPGLPADARPLELIRVRAGSFVMGATSNDPGYYSQLEWPSHPVTLTYDYFLGKCEITQAQWRAVMGSIPKRITDGGDDYPIYYVSWKDCQDFARRLSDWGLGLFRLPTEAEWEYACRAGTTTRFSFGDCPEVVESYSYYEEPSRFVWWFGNNTPSGAKPVGLKLPNPWGFFDMHGNVYEWCSDWWENPYPREPQIDPHGPSSGTVHVSKGGHWYGSILHCRSAFRFFEQEAEQIGGIFWGLRIVKEIPDSLVPDWERID